MNTHSTVIAENDSRRLVRQWRNQTIHPGCADLTLERCELDAMLDPRWVYVNSWVIRPGQTGAVEQALLLLVNALYEDFCMSKPTTQNLAELSQSCILRSANSSNPRRVLEQHFEKAFELGFREGQQKGLTQSSESLETMAEVG